jgi:hypothetical protein
MRSTGLQVVLATTVVIALGTVLYIRGSASSLASDFGGVEVWGGANVGGTDPHDVAAALRAELGANALVGEQLVTWLAGQQALARADYQATA